MKELTIEEKAQRYDEALKEAVVAHKDEDRHLKATLERIFPELKESEDEKIRKAMIDFFKHEREEGITVLHYGVNIESMIAWLEKQGEQKHDDKVEPKFKVGDVIRLKGSAAEYTIKRVTDTTYYTDGWSCSIERCEEDYELVGQKSVWSEEDEMRFNNIFTLLEELPLSQNWLKSLKDRVQPQPRQEWSEEDENIKESIITGLEMLKDGASDKSLIALYNKKIEWLKSIRPQNTWKPSEEQMEALYEETQKSNRIKDDRIVSLYNDLKKLREE